MIAFLRLAFAGTLLVVVTPAVAAEPTPLAAALASTARDLPAGGLVAAEVDGASVTFASAGQPAPAPAAGLAPETLLFEIGSLTKVFTGLLLAQAVVAAEVALDDPITRHLPADLAAALAPEVAAITLAQLATHTSGLPRLPDNLAPPDATDPYATYDEEALFAFLRAHRPAAAPPQAAAYSNLGAGLLGHLLARRAGLTYGELVAARITGPLGLRDTGIALTADQRPRLAPPHSGRTTVASWQFAALAGAGALRSTAADLARFAQALMAAEVDPAHPLHAAWQLARTPRTTLQGAGIGLAIFVHERDGATWYSHGGGTGGYRSFFEFSPARRAATVVLLNNDEPNAELVVVSARHRAAATAGSRPGAGADAAAPAPAAPVEVALPAGRNAADYTGVYRLDGPGAAASFTFVLDAAGQLRARLTGQPFLPLFHRGAERFFYRAVPAELQFTRDAATDALVQVTLFQNGREITARRTGDQPPPMRFLSREALSAYVGRYALAPGAEFELSVRAETLFAKLTGQPALPVFATQPDTFVYDVVLAALSFERDAEGRVVALVLHQNGRDQRAPRMPAP